ncbi:MAG: VanZ family protein [Rhodobacteraceae bacterium]|nr:VanZ family protein [Paracoccaceae bacterium]NCW52277.1 VanZ family protein [Paracoccaceae bacterium]
MRKYYSDVFLTLALLTGLTFALLWPIEASGGLRGGDKVVHFLAFAILAFPIACTGRLRMSILFFACSIYGGVIELLQPSFGREAEVLDWIADMLGVAFGIFVGGKFCQHNKRNNLDRDSQNSNSHAER